MTKPPTNPSTSKSKALVYLEYVLLAVCLSVIALRTTFTEGPAVQSPTLAANLGDSLYSLSVSAVLTFSFVLWVVWSFCGKRFLYRPTGIEIGLGIFCAAAVIAGFAAADKRLAITVIAVFLAPPLMALLLVQILDSQQKIKLVLAVIAALGVVSAYQCAEQFLVSNQITIEQYEQDKQSLLEPLGIEPGTFQQFIFEHRLYSRGVRGFFTTRNSAGSFALIALFAAVALFIAKLRNRKPDSSGSRHLLACGSIAAVILLSLALTRSKGAIIALLLAAAAATLLLFFGDWLKAHRKALLVAGLLLAIVGGWVVVSYGLNHDRLPGGSSMLVRWQYWHASAKMYADHPLTGVGPGNFTHFYPHYKPAPALESVADPHNFPLSIVTQYGPLGLVGFLAMIFIPLWRTVSPNPAGPSAKTDQARPAFSTLATAFLIVISTVLLLIRPILTGAAPAETFDVIIYVIVTLYVAPVAVFIIGFALLAGPLRKIRHTKYDIRNTSTAVILSCAILGVALHNLIDFAIFEPGVLTAFWAMITCLIAINSHTNPRPHVALKPVPFVRILIVTAALAACWAYFSYALVPVARSTAKIRQANRAISAGHFEYAHQLLEKASEDDSLSPAAPFLNGRLYLRHFQLTQGKDRDLLLRSEKCLQAAIERNNTVFKNFERLTDVYCSLAEISTQQKKNDWLNKALDTASLTVERYPGCGRVHFKLAQIAGQLGKTNIAIEEYTKAIEIEDKYRGQFRQMYAERKKIVSRLGEEKYQLAVERVKELSEKPDI
ncbi:MAG: O-antigen ligase family protein [Planctomycetota bacterium]|jgi:O-antigen ligase